MYKIRRTEDVEEARDAHALAFPGDSWVGDDHEFWLAYDARGAVVGFCSAIYKPETNTVFLSRAAVVRAARGAGLQRRMIRVRLAWAKKIGARATITYTGLDNYESVVNLLRCGFRFEATAPDGWASYHLMYHGARPSSAAFSKMC